MMEETLSGEAGLREILSGLRDDAACREAVQRSQQLVRSLVARLGPQCTAREHMLALQCLRNIATAGTEVPLAGTGLAPALVHLMQPGGIATSEDPGEQLSGLVQFYALQTARCALKSEPGLRDELGVEGWDAVVGHALVRRFMRLPDGRTLWFHVDAARMLHSLASSGDPQVCAHLAERRGYKPILEHLAGSRYPVMRAEAAAAMRALGPHLALCWDNLQDHDRELIRTRLNDLASDQESDAVAQDAQAALRSLDPQSTHP